MGNSLASLGHFHAPPSPPTPISEDKFFWLEGADARATNAGVAAEGGEDGGEEGGEGGSSVAPSGASPRWIPVVHIAKDPQSTGGAKDGGGSAVRPDEGDGRDDVDSRTAEEQNPTEDNASRRRTLLYCHGHDVDLGLLYDFLVHLSKVLDVDILSFDYAGYGPVKPQHNIDHVAPDGGQPTPTEEQCNFDAWACYTYLVEERGVLPQNIVVYGKGLGSGPALWLAHKLCQEEMATSEMKWMDGTLANDSTSKSEGRKATSMKTRVSTPVPRGFFKSKKDKDDKNGSNSSMPPLGGLILHSAFLALDDGTYNNMKQLKEMHTSPDHPGSDVPIYLIHGKGDTVVPASHGKEMYRLLMKRRKKGFLPFWADGGTHWNIEHKYAIAYIKRLQQFLRHCERATYGEVPDKKGRKVRGRSTSRERSSGRQDASSDADIGRHGGYSRFESASSHEEQRSRPHRSQDAHDARPPRGRSESRARRRKKKGTLVMRGVPDHEAEVDVGRCVLRSAYVRCSVDGGTSHQRVCAVESTRARESRDPLSTQASF